MMEGNETAKHLVMYLGLCIFICIALVQLKDLLLQKAEVFIGKVTPSVQAASASLLFTLALLNLPWLSPKSARAKGISSAGRGWDVSSTPSTTCVFAKMQAGEGARTMPADHPPVKDQPWEVVAGSKEAPALSRILASISIFLSRPAISPFTQLLWNIFHLPYPTIATVVSCICFVPAYLHVYPPGPTSHVNTATYDSSLIQALILAFVSVALGDTFVVMSHLIEPPHPKFTLLAKRRFFIRLHVFSGITEILFGICAFFSATPLPAVIGMVVADLAGHFPTSILQTPGLFGTKEITLPAYYVMIASKAASAVYLAFNPYDLWPLLSLFLLHHVYVWVRIYYAAFLWLGEMNDYLYTISILMAGLTCGPVALGVTSTLGLVLAVLIFPKLYLPWKYPNYETNIQLQAYYKGENARNLYTNDGFKESLNRAVARANHGPDYNMAPKQQAELWLKAYGSAKGPDGQVYMDLDDFTAFLKAWGMPCLWLAAPLVRSIIDVDKDGLISFDEMYAFKHTSLLQPVWTFMQEHHKAKVSDPPGCDRISCVSFHPAFWDDTIRPATTAQVVFETIDSDNSGRLSMTEIGLMLMSWGVPPSDVRLVMEEFDKDGSGHLSFEEFFKHFKIVYHFAFDCIKKAVQAKKAQDAARVARTNGTFAELALEHMQA